MLRNCVTEGMWYILLEYLIKKATVFLVDLHTNALYKTIKTFLKVLFTFLSHMSATIKFIFAMHNI